MAIHRSIVAILAADVAGYSRLVAADDEGTLQRFAERAVVFREVTTDFEGRVFSTAGDSFMAEFPSAVQALRAAVAIQRRLARLNADLVAEQRIEFRMGITIGDVIDRGSELMGDGVNIAARLQALADPGGICISRSVHEAVGTAVSVRYRDIGQQRLKNIPRPVPALRVIMAEDGRDGGRGSVLVRIGKTVAAVAAVAAVGGAGWWFFTQNPTVFRSAAVTPVLQGEAETAARTALTVSVARPERRCFADALRLGGTVVPRDEIEVRPESEGYKVTRILAEPLGEVTAGQTLAQLNFLGSSASPPVFVRAPVAGTVGRSTATLGGLASPQAPALFTVIAGGELEFVADVPAPLLSRLKPGQGVSVVPLGGRPFAGRVRVISSVADPASQSAKVRVSLAGDAALRPGTFGRALVTIGERCGLGVPSSALLRGPEGTAVYAAVNDLIEARPVQTGLSSEGRVEIVSGLSDTDMVVQQAGPFLREGDFIRIVTGGDRKS